jgi:hypothetical protein
MKHSELRFAADLTGASGLDCEHERAWLAWISRAAPPQGTRTSPALAKPSSPLSSRSRSLSLG